MLRGADRRTIVSIVLAANRRTIVSIVLAANPRVERGFCPGGGWASLSEASYGLEKPVLRCVGGGFIKFRTPRAR
jgi:hypothetical protein